MFRSKEKEDGFEKPEGDVDVGSNWSAAVIREKLAGHAASQVDGALHDLFKMLTRRIDAQDACWVGSVRFAPAEVTEDDVLLGWRVGAVSLMSQDPAYQAYADEKEKIHDEDPPMPSIVLAREAGKLRVQRLMGGMVDMEVYRKTSAYHSHEQFWIIDRFLFPCRSTRTWSLTLSSTARVIGPFSAWLTGRPSVRSSVASLGLSRSFPWRTVCTFARNG